MFSLTKIKPLLYLARFLMGMTESFIIIYGPVWVNNYSPPDHSTRWMGILHSSSAIGVMLGYLTAGVTINFFSAYVTWRFSIQIQGVVQIPISLYFFFEDEKYINIETTNDSETIEILREKAKLESPRMTDKKKYVTSFVDPRPKMKTEGDNYYSPQTNPKRNKSHYALSGEHEMRGGEGRNSHRERSDNRSLRINPSKEFKKEIKRQATRIDAVEINHLQGFCNEAGVFIAIVIHIY